MAKKPPSPFRFLSTDELAAEMELSVTAIRALQKWGAPFVAKKSHPRLLIEWMAHHPDKVLKLE
jgi:biotin operon repressor